MSISSAAFLIPRNAASTVVSGSPTKVTTVRLVLAPGSTSSNDTPSTNSIASVICRITFWSRPSEKFGTHSISFFMRRVDLSSVITRLRFHRNIDVARSGELDGLGVTCVGVTEDAHARIAGENTAQAAFGIFSAVSDNYHARMLRKTDAHATAVM